MATVSTTITNGITLGTSGAYASPLTIAMTGGVSAATGNAIYGPGSQAWSVENHGAIYGGNYGVYLNASGTVDNSGTIGGYGGVNIRGATGTVENTGMISVSSYGVVLGQLGRAGPVIVVNSGTIVASGEGGGFSFPTGVELLANGSVTNEAGGKISGNHTGIELNAGGAVTNMAQGTISSAQYGIRAYGSSVTVRNAGEIDGGGGTNDSVYLSASSNNLLIVDAGAVFGGEVAAASSPDNTIELTSGAIAGTLNGLGDKYFGFQTLTIDPGASWTIAGPASGIAATTIEGFNTNDTIDLLGVTFSSSNYAILESGSDLLLVYNSGSVIGEAQLSGDFTGDFFHLTDDNNHGTFITEDTACYCRGTLILTTKGEVAVEHLRIGDLLVTRSGAPRPIRWIGTRAYSGRFAAGNKTVLPIRIAAGALADNVPKRNLFVSPLHAMFIDDALIPAIALVNGTSIAQAEAFERIEYFHLELDSHDVIVAEGALAESFIDDDSRGMFHNADEYRRLYPSAPRKPAEYCAPIVEDGAELEAVRARIAARATSEKMNRAA